MNYIDLIKLMISVIVLNYTNCRVFPRPVFMMVINDGRGPPTIYHLFIVATDGLVTQLCPGSDNYFNELNIFH